jgi:hypothetical protein
VRHKQAQDEQAGVLIEARAGLREAGQAGRQVWSFAVSDFVLCSSQTNETAVAEQQQRQRHCQACMCKYKQSQSC